MERAAVIDLTCKIEKFAALVRISLWDSDLKRAQDAAEALAQAAKHLDYGLRQLQARAELGMSDDVED